VCKNGFVSLVLALSAMAIELIPLGDYDNLLIPVAIGGLAQLLIR